MPPQKPRNLPEIANFATMKPLRTIYAIIALATAIHAAADIRWLETAHDFGAFNEEMGPATCSFRFVNNGTAPVEILAARASCGCTSPAYTRKPVAPGDTGTVTVTYDPAGRPGRFSKFVAVDIDNAPRVKLIVKGTVVGSSESVGLRYPVDAGNGLMLRRGAVMFGQIKKGRTRTASVDIYNRTNDSITPQITVGPAHLTAMMEPKTIAPGEQATAIFYFNSGRCNLYGLVNDSITITAGTHSYALPAVAIIEEDFDRLTPKELAKAPVAAPEADRIDFGNISGTQPVSRTCLLRNNGKSPLIVRRLYSADPGISVNIDRTTIKPGKTALITATVDPATLTGAILNARASLITNDPANPTATIRLVGTR